MATSIRLKFLTLKWNISRTICRIEVSDGSLFCIFHALSFQLNFIFDRRFPLKYLAKEKVKGKTNYKFDGTLDELKDFVTLVLKRKGKMDWEEKYRKTDI